MPHTPDGAGHMLRPLALCCHKGEADLHNVNNASPGLRHHTYTLMHTHIHTQPHSAPTTGATRPYRVHVERLLSCADGDQFGTRHAVGMVVEARHQGSIHKHLSNTQPKHQPIEGSLALATRPRVPGHRNLSQPNTSQQQREAMPPQPRTTWDPPAGALSCSPSTPSLCLINTRVAAGTAGSSVMEEEERRSTVQPRLTVPRARGTIRGRSS
jgi:hypothetical protein